MMELDILKKYEETDLTPEEITAMKAALERYREAERDGRLAIRPCTVGDTVYVKSNTWGNVWNFKTILGGEYLVGKIIAIINTKKQTLMKIQVRHSVEWKRARKRYTINAIGITVFLTHEAAEAALSERSENDTNA